MSCYSSPQLVFLASALFVSLVASSGVSGQADEWDSATATSTFNGQELAGCGFENQTEYQGKTVAVSTSIYADGKTCGACFEIKIKCSCSSTCLPQTVQVTVALACAPSYFNGTRNWCQRPRKHFELPTSIFSHISNDEGAVVPVQFRRVMCVRQGGIRFKILGSRGVVGVLVYNVAGRGDVLDVKIKGSATEWVGMINGGDQRWVTARRMSLSGQSLSFGVTSSDGKVVDSINVAPKNWKLGDVYEGGQFVSF
ncbi:hypothetical protein QQ045_014241 [Rhodiola kirilowii]